MHVICFSRNDRHNLVPRPTDETHLSQVTNRLLQTKGLPDALSLVEQIGIGLSGSPIQTGYLKILDAPSDAVARIASVSAR